MPFDFGEAASSYRNYVKVRVRGGRFKQPNLSDPQLKTIGDSMVAKQFERWSKAVDAYGNPAPKLTPRYAIIKQKKFHVRPVRDNKMTGLLIKNFGLRKAAQNTIRAENTSKTARDHARRAQGYAEMIGFAASDQVEVFTAANEQYGIYLKHAWVQLSGVQAKPY
ncbi:MAG TPA: hypothetical protein VFV58_39180 [Blastocatellia bacterium]|jgi:hypothetical protein|nr:hypothetical protein [Blastocatellia bacterium]